jgi:purine-binding chemotaxis protein CheW
MADSGQSSDRRYLTFRSENRLYALPARQVAEVIRVTSLARVPQAPKCLLGLANLRGAVMPVASIRGLLGLAEAPTTTTSRLIVLDGGTPVALEVDAVAALVTVAQSEINAGDAELSAAAGEQLQGVFQSNGNVTKILDIAALLGRSFPRAAPRQRSSSVGFARGDEKPVIKNVGRRLVTFDVTGQEYALNLDVVQEIVNIPRSFTHVSGSDEAVLGIMAHRQRLLPLLSLRILLGMPGASHARDKVIVTMLGDTLIGLVADGTRSVISADPGRIEQAPAVLSARAGGEARIVEIYRAGAGRLISILAPERLFRGEVMQKLTETNHTLNAGAAVAAEQQVQDQRFLAFKLNGNEFALPIDAIDEVARVPDHITRLPKTPKFLEGVVNLRGVVLPVVDQRRRFDMPVMEAGAARRLVVVRTEQHRAGLIVDSVTEVLRCSSEAIKAAPDLTGEALGMVRSVINLEAAGRMLLLLDPSELLSRAERSLLDSFSTDTAGKQPRPPRR